MRDPEILHAFNEKRGEFKPYGLTSEIWIPSLMKKPDRHNEIEINYLTEGSLVYFFQGSKITIPPNSLTVFWGLVPHQIIDHTGSSPYYVCTIPLTQFLEWRLPSTFVDRVLKGEILIENSGDYSFFDEFLINNWIKDLSTREGHLATLLEMRARLIRMTDRVLSDTKSEQVQIHTREISKVELIAMYIAQNYTRPIKTADIGREAGLHPDYANVVFKKSFGMTLNEYVIQERISHAQRKLVSTDKSITDILYECGFNSISSFNTAFRRINSCTPREFRKRYH